MNPLVPTEYNKTLAILKIAKGAFGVFLAAVITMLVRSIWATFVAEAAPKVQMIYVFAVFFLTLAAMGLSSYKNVHVTVGAIAFLAPYYSIVVFWRPWNLVSALSIGIVVISFIVSVILWIIFNARSQEQVDYVRQKMSSTGFDTDPVQRNRLKHWDR